MKFKSAMPMSNSMVFNNQMNVPAIPFALQYIQVNKTFSKNVQGCRDGSAKNHSN